MSAAAEMVKFAADLIPVFDSSALRTFLMLCVHSTGKNLSSVPQSVSAAAATTGAPFLDTLPTPLRAAGNRNWSTGSSKRRAARMRAEAQ